MKFRVCSINFLLLIFGFARPIYAQIEGNWALDITTLNGSRTVINVSLEERNNGQITGVYETSTSNSAIRGTVDSRSFVFSSISEAFGGEVRFEGEIENSSPFRGRVFISGQEIGTFQGIRAPHDSNNYPLLDFNEMATENVIDVGTHELEFRIIDGHEPAIVFENGGGEDFTAWNRVLSVLRESIDNKLVTYNRAGISNSTNYDGEYDIEKEADGLYRAFEDLGINHKIIYVGHSYGAFLLKMYANKYPESVASLLYIDPNTVEFVLGSDLDDRERENFDPDSIEDIDYREAMAKQLYGMPQTVEKLASIPDTETSCKVVSSGLPIFPNTKDQNLFNLSHQNLATLCSFPLIVAERSGHSVQVHQPKLVAQQVLELLSQ